MVVEKRLECTCLYQPANERMNARYQTKMRNVFNFEKRKRQLIEEKEKWRKREDDKDCALVLSSS